MYVNIRYNEVNALSLSESEAVKYSFKGWDRVEPYLFFFEKETQNDMGSRMKKRCFL